MPKMLNRVIISLIVPCLITGVPVSNALALANPSPSCQKVQNLDTRFQREAITDALAGVIKPIMKRPKLMWTNGWSSSFSAAPAALKWGTPAWKRATEAANARLAAMENHHNLVASAQKYFRAGRPDLAREVLSHLSDLLQKILSAEAEIREALENQAPPEEQAHFENVVNMLLQSLVDGTFPESEEDLMAHPVVQASGTKWIDDHTKAGRVFDLVDLIDVPYEKILHRLPLINSHRNIVVDMWNYVDSLHSGGQWVSKMPPEERKEFVDFHAKTLKEVINGLGELAHRAWNSNRDLRPDNRIAAMKSSSNSHSPAMAVLSHTAA